MNRRGTALIIVLLFLLLLTTLQLENLSRGNKTLDMMETNYRYFQALSLAYGGIQYGLRILSQDEDLKIDWLGEEWAKGPFFWKGEKVRVWIEDEDRRVNVNRLKKGNVQEKRERLEQLLELCDYFHTSYSLVPSLLDWIDGDKEVTVLPFIEGENSGAEEEYYSLLNPPRRVKNAPLDVPEEILLIKGMDEEAWSRGWKNVVTVWSKGKVNINTTDFPVLLATLQVYSPDKVDESLVKEIMEVRKNQPFSSVSELAPLLPGELWKRFAKSRLITFSSSFFRITSEARLEKIRIRLLSVWERKREGFELKYMRVD